VTKIDPATSATSFDLRDDQMMTESDSSALEELKSFDDKGPAKSFDDKGPAKH
jgi:hypothetical protein